MKNYPKILHVTTPLACSDFFVDFNGAIHHVANEVLLEEHDDYDHSIINKSWDYLQDCINIVKPTTMVHVCTDGVAPIAKIYQQRKRRYLSVWRNQQSGLVGNQKQWDRNKISPGTSFMTQLNAFIRQSIRDRDTSLDIHYYFSGSDEVGEGEHKIFSRIASLPQHSKIIIHGLDADLIMLSLISHHPNVYLMREPSGSYKDMRTNDGFMYVEIDTLRYALLNDLKIHYAWPITDQMLGDVYSDDANKVIETYVVICSILGNDFLPHPPTLPLKKNGHERLLQAARDAWYTCGNLIMPGCNINFRFVAEVLKHLSQTEDGDMWKYNEEYMKRRPFESKEDPLDAYPLINKDEVCKVIYHNVPSKWRTYYYKHMFNTKLHDTTVVSIASKLFIQGIVWVYRYYKRHPKDAQWYYPYNYAPSLRDLFNFSAGLTQSDEADMVASFNTPASQGFLHPFTQLLCIMPIQSSHILPKKVRDIMHDAEKGCKYLFPIGFHIQTYMKMHLWECVPVLPFLNIHQLERALETS